MAVQHLAHGARKQPTRDDAWTGSGVVAVIVATDELGLHVAQQDVRACESRAAELADRTISSLA